MPGVFYLSLSLWLTPSLNFGQKSSLSSMDSDLEAFSHNPADGSFAALPDQTAAKTNYSMNGSSRTKFNYYCDNIHQ
ncbi:unnamed protein product [Candida parapsilosis]